MNNIVRHSCVLLLIILTFAFTSCGGGFPEDEDCQHTPAISKLRYNKVGDSRSVHIELAVDFTDEEGDVSTAKIELSDGPTISWPQDLNGATSGIINLEFDVITSTPESVPFSVYIIDSEGCESNILKNTESN
jgi:hypothetical protein